ncbi:MAG: relaxase domain-containing protein, partial [Ottowia sp.]|nr:relaxase domain-containing protein [Ottowia sp.]
MISAYAIPSGGAAASYHDKAFAQDGASKTADNYYVNESASAMWQGKGAEILGIKNTAVKREDFINFLDGKIRNPANGEIQDLADNSRGADRRAGWDFTISAPKSVSIVGLVGGDQRVIDAHIRANAAAMMWIEEHASLIRVKDSLGKNVKELAGNLLWATVQHETSRANEPGLHNHNVIAAVVYDSKRKKWRSLTNDELLKLRADGDYVYKGVLAKDLREAGYELRYEKNGRDFEIVGLTSEQIETYSTRSSQIDDALRKRGYEPETASWAARQAAALDTRSKKDELPREVLHEVWLEKAKEVALDLDSIVTKSKERVAGFSIESIAQTKALDRKEALAAVSWAVAHLSEREQSFTVPALEAAAVKFARGDIADVKSAIASHLKNDLIVDRKQIQSGARWLTTHKGINSEMCLRENILAGKNNGRAVLTSKKEFQAEVKAFEAKKTAETGQKFKLSDEQVNAAKNILMHEDMYQGIQGEAGTGKTAALAMVREVATKKGWHVMGIATAASAARELGVSSGIESRTLASFFVERENALRAVRLEIASLKAACEARGMIRSKEAPRIESKHL